MNNNNQNRAIKIDSEGKILITRKQRTRSPTLIEKKRKLRRPRSRKKRKNLGKRCCTKRGRNLRVARTAVLGTNRYTVFLCQVLLFEKCWHRLRQSNNFPYERFCISLRLPLITVTERDQRRSLLLDLYYKAYSAAPVIQTCDSQHNIKKENQKLKYSTVLFMANIVITEADVRLDNRENSAFMEPKFFLPYRIKVLRRCC